MSPLAVSRERVMTSARKASGRRQPYDQQLASSMRSIAVAGGLPPAPPADGLIARVPQAARPSVQRRSSLRDPRIGAATREPLGPAACRSARGVRRIAASELVRIEIAPASQAKPRVAAWLRAT